MKRSKVVLLLFFALCLLLAPLLGPIDAQVPAGQEPTPVGRMDAWLKDHPEVSKFLNEHRLAESMQRKGSTFEQNYPKLVRAIRKGKVQFPQFNRIWQGVQANDVVIVGWAIKHEQDKLATKQFLKKIDKLLEQQACSDCLQMTDLVVIGCFAGGGDTWFCFLYGEQYMCVCRNALCDQPYVECGVIFPN
jgi:hypothetical protein